MNDSERMQRDRRDDRRDEGRDREPRREKERPGFDIWRVLFPPQQRRGDRQ
jgi:hypothetical protein